jgi:arsenate reductase
VIINFLIIIQGKTLKVLVYRKCSTCLKALKWLEVNQVVFDERPIKEENPSYEELKAWYEMSGLPLKKFFNTSGILYKQMNLKDKLKEMSEDEQLKLLATDGMLVKRPLVIGDDFVLTGFKEKEWEDKING